MAPWYIEAGQISACDHNFRASDCYFDYFSIDACFMQHKKELAPRSQIPPQKFWGTYEVRRLKEVTLLSSLMSMKLTTSNNKFK